MSNCTRVLIYFVAILLIGLFLLGQIQHRAIRSRAAAGGSFGIRPQSHDCIGYTVNADRLSSLPRGDIEIDSFLHLRYLLKADDPNKLYCIGQDIWMGE